MTRHDILSKTVLHCAVDGGGRCGGQRKNWCRDVKERAVRPMPTLPSSKTGINGGKVYPCAPYPQRPVTVKQQMNE